MIARLRHWLATLAAKRENATLEREIERALARHRIVGRARAEAARRGQRTHWKRAAANCRAMYGEMAR